MLSSKGYKGFGRFRSEPLYVNAEALTVIQAQNSRKKGLLMDTADLKEYLGIVVDMEKNIFLQNQLMRQFEAEIARLGKETKLLEPPCPQKQEYPAKPFPPSPPDKIAFKLAKKRFCISLGVVIALAVFMFIAAYAQDPSIATDIYEMIAFGTVVSAVIAAAAYFSHCGEDMRKEKQYNLDFAYYKQRLQEYKEKCVRAEAQNQTTARSYQAALEIYHNDAAREKQRVMQENIKKDVLLVELSRMRDQNKASEEVLKQVYDKNIIFPKYRNLVMVCSLYEYICAGRCDALEGHEGAYNILEIEIRLDKVIVQLDRVISMLGRISQSQYIIYTAIQEANQQSAEILESTYQIADRLQELQASNREIIGGIESSIQATEQHTVVLAQEIEALQKSAALTAYQAERTQKELHYMNRMKYFSGDYDNAGLLLRTPPN